MSQNLESARLAIEAELFLCKQNVVRYLSRFDALTKSLAHLSGKHGSAVNGNSKSRRMVNLAENIVNPELTAKGKKSGKKNKGLPFTGGCYFPDLITTVPQFRAEILHAAINNLGFAPTDEQIKVLGQRLAMSLHSLLKKGEIKQVGKVRARRYFKK